jgi:hypothetical protein
MNNKAIMTEAIVRITIAVIAVVIIGVMISRIYNTVAYSDAEKRFDGFVESIEKLQPGQSEQDSVSLDKNSAMIGFSRESQKVEFYLEVGKRYKMNRPGNCEDEQACICLCSGNLDGSAGGVEVELACSGALKCKSFDQVEISSIFPAFSLSTVSKFTMTGGFIVRRGEKALGVNVKDRVFQLQSTRNDNTITICDPKKC